MWSLNVLLRNVRSLNFILSPHDILWHDIHTIFGHNPAATQDVALKMQSPKLQQRYVLDFMLFWVHILTFMSSGSCTPFHWFHFEGCSVHITIANLVSINGPAHKHKWYSHCVTSIDLSCRVCKGVEVVCPCCLHVADC